MVHRVLTEFSACRIMPAAPAFATVDLAQIKVLAPWEPKNKTGLTQWVNGRLQFIDGTDVVVTAPKFRVCFSGCKYDKLVVAMDDEEPTRMFRDWLERLGAEVLAPQVQSDPERFKPGAKSSQRFLFDNDLINLIKPSNDPTMYPDQFTMRLSTERSEEAREDSEGNIVQHVVNASLFRVLEDGTNETVSPESITAGSFVHPIIKLSYFRNVDRFGLRATLLRGRVYPRETTPGIANDDWEMDTSN